MATPHVAGAAALVWSRSDVTSNSQVVDILLNSADGQGVGERSTRLVDHSWRPQSSQRRQLWADEFAADAEAGPDQTVTDADGDGSELVSLDGSASSDQDGTIASLRVARRQHIDR